MNWFRHFMAGGMPREEAASALLAASLEGVPSFREYFFRLIETDEPEKLVQENWQYDIEESHVDVTLRSDSTIILIENKIKTASMSDRTQLVRYYSEFLQRYPNHRFYVVFLTPSGRGNIFVQSLRNDKQFQSRKFDRVVKITWNELAQYTSQVDDVAVPFASKAIESIAKASQKYIQIKSVRQSTGVACAEIVEEAFGHIKSNTNIPLQYWGPDDKAVPGHIYFQMYSTKYPVTLWSGILVHKDDVDKDIDAIEQPMRYFVKIKLNESRVNNRVKKGMIDESYKTKFKEWWAFFQNHLLANHPVGADYVPDKSKKWLVYDDVVDFDNTKPARVLQEKTCDILHLIEHSLQDNRLDILS